MGVNALVSPGGISPRIARIDTNVREKLVKIRVIRGKNASNVPLGNESNCTQIKLDHGYRIDLLVEQKVVVELKVVDQIAPLHEAQVLSYLRFSGCKVGLLLNFDAKLLKDGIRRFNDLNCCSDYTEKKIPRFSL